MSNLLSKSMRQFLAAICLFFFSLTGLLHAQTLRGAIIDGDTFGVVTAIDNNQKPLPSDFRLFQNYPNPLNSSTQVRFTTPKSAFVGLRIYNILGEEVGTLVSEKLDPGEHCLCLEGYRHGRRIILLSSCGG